MRPTRILLAPLLLANAAPDLPAPAYPQTRKVDLVEHPFGQPVADPYRWLENDVRADPEVAGWVARQNAVTASYLATLPARDWFANRIRALTDYERFGLPKKAANRYFYLRNTGLQNQSQLWLRPGLHGTPRLLLDPNLWSKDGATALDPELWQPSRNGRYLAYGIQDGGSDWRSLRIVDTRTGQVLPEVLQWANDTQLAWVGNEGVLYSRFPAPPPGREFQAATYGKSVWFHRIGTPQSADELVYATPDHPEWGHKARVTSDGRFALITTEVGTDSRFELHVIDLAARPPGHWPARLLVPGFTSDWKLVDAIGHRLWFVTNHQAPRYRLVSVDLAGPQPQWQQLVAQSDATLQQAAIVGRRLILTYLRDAASTALIVDLDGRHPQELTLNDFGTAAGFRGRPGDPETFFSFAGFTRPPGVYRYDVRTGRAEAFATPVLAFHPADYRVEQVFYPSKDGTRVPMFVVRRADIAAAHRAVPTLLYGYGGFDIALTPGFVPARMAWLQAGGAFALANLRGGGEYGREWHDAGRLANKQNVFDDFIAAGEWLIANGVTPKDGLAIQGGSNGGLLVGAVTNQRPDLFAAANPQVGVMDMLRFDRFTAGRYWTDDYGSPAVEKDWKVLRAYSPYHNIAGGRDYPAILVTTADTDDRVVPGHSFKYTAALQAAAIGDKPHLIRIESRAGHGAGKPTDKVVAESADILAFLAHWTGLQPESK
ncbi:MAG: prolyl oligopeptidase family serine peptidase [Sphingomonadales bacterium]|nr:prolyl oligopeptidase family serine peptidase [Sphingomonadales bacterium]